MFTNEQKEAAKNYRCPYCGSAQLNYEGSHMYGNSYWDEVFCMECEASWSLIYELTDAAENEPPRESVSETRDSIDPAPFLRNQEGDPSEGRYVHRSLFGDRK